MADLKPGFEKMEAVKADLMRGLASLDAETLNRRPGPSAWSILQVVAHLTKSEGGTLQYIKKKTQNPSALPKAGLVPWLRIGTLIVGIRSPYRFKAPEAIADVPEQGDFQAASLAWAEVRDHWREYVDNFPAVLNDRVIFRHPFVGLLGPAQTMIFLNEHLGNHVRQIGRIRKALGA